MVAAVVPLTLPASLTLFFPLLFPVPPSPPFSKKRTNIQGMRGEGREPGPSGVAALGQALCQALSFVLI